MPCFHTSWIGNDLFLFPYFLEKHYILIFFHLFINVFITSFCAFFKASLLFVGGGGGMVKRVSLQYRKWKYLLYYLA